MKVRELIEKLDKVDNKDLEVICAMPGGDGVWTLQIHDVRVVNNEVWLTK